MSFTIIVPARFASTRLPGKPLADLGGAPMVVRVAQQAARIRSARIIVATDDARIAQAVSDAGIETLMTRPDHPTGTDRIAEAVETLGLPDHSIVVNVQGDEPFLAPTLIERVAEKLVLHEDAAMATACHPLRSLSEARNPNVVKVVLDHFGYALYFSRALIPFARDAMASLPEETILSAYPAEHPLYRHYGLYAYRASFLRLFPTLPMAPIEDIEKLEQLRVLWHGYRIVVEIADEAPAPGIDTEEDLAAARQLWAQTHGV
ncbi:MAG: 3-deoxy-manno-octulosonate cytidylyltransferase [Burkholderiales bacterium]|jgi:3-deoxy-manno-octulosonate cytidylyltransferase (CMP-KDO synthetase)|nr:3-deoxy-manno-octulosonate cytidylyltransferase [Burkholderiales bacterium]